MLAFLPVGASLQLLTKGLEEEVYTGTVDGSVVGLSDRISQELEGFETEPDRRNVEFITEPYRDYDELLDRLMAKRCRLRRFLREIGGYTLVPGSTLSLGGADEFQISDEHNAYYGFIRDSYGTDVVTASSHLNIGVEDDEDLVRAYRVLRAEASMFLAWTAASPFLNGEVTGFHSTRWHIFPKTPVHVPFFRDRAAFVAWVEARLADGSMQNPRHLWASVRPNGPESPHELSRLELRVCDRTSCPESLKAVVAFLEARVWSVLEDPTIDPLSLHDDEALQVLVRDNEEAAACQSLDAELRDWQTGRTVRAKDWIAERVESLGPVLRSHGLDQYMPTLLERLKTGSTAQCWLEQVRRGRTVESVIEEATREMADQDVEVMGAECS